MVDERSAFLRASWINVVSNVLKIGVEGALGITFGSIALLADAVHSIADLLASLIVLIWGRFVFDEPDPTHPHGHERFEPLTALFVGLILVFLGGVLLYESINALRFGSQATYSIFLIIGLSFAFIDRFACFYYTKRLNRIVNSNSLHALATDSLNDLYTTGAAFVGILGMAVGYPFLDPVAGGIVSVVVIYQGFQICRENIDYLVDRAPSDDIQREIKDVILSHPRVHGVHDFAVYYSGPLLEVEFHAEIRSDITIREAHEIETELRDQLREIEPVDDVHIHLDPSGIGEWKDSNSPTK
ncbi:MAG: cation diffusion facilitator family transporter [Halobacteriaceae archaeon]